MVALRLSNGKLPQQRRSSLILICLTLYYPCFLIQTSEMAVNPLSPRALFSSAASQQPVGPLPTGWEQLWDPEVRQPFFIDHNTQTTTVSGEGPHAILGLSPLGLAESTHTYHMDTHLHAKREAMCAMVLWARLKWSLFPSSSLLVD